jgi:cation:H+ antiporter
MDTQLLVQSVLIMVFASVIIHFAASTFHVASCVLGRNMPPGVRGATINAIGSSLPEVLTTFFLLFVYSDMEGFSAGIATCAGSAVFNLSVIPGLCILFAVGFRRKQPQKKTEVRVRHETILRDGLFFLLAELVLISYLGNQTLTWWMGGTLMGIYVLYMAYLLNLIHQHGKTEHEVEPLPEIEKSSLIRTLLTLNSASLLFGGRELTKARAWVVLLVSTAFMAVACHFLAKAVIDSSTALDIPAFFTAVILGAAATSVPDTILSVKDAQKGDYDDAISNAVGSNIFDLTIALGLPLLVYGLMYGDVTLANTAGDVRELRVALVLLTVLILGTLLSSKVLGRKRGYFLLGIYGAWTLFIVGRAMNWAWLNSLIGSA